MKIFLGDKACLLPDFLIVGSARCGTTSIYSHLKEHPEIYMPSLKEPHFFNYLNCGISPHAHRSPWTIADYEALFNDAIDVQKLGEASASYLYFHDIVIPTMSSIYGEKARDVKIVMVLRNPIDRAWSYHMLMRRNGHEMGFFEMVDKYCGGKDKTFHDFIGAGHYFEQVKDYLDFFESVKIFMFEDLKLDAASVVRNIFELIGVSNTEFVPSNINATYNASGVPKSGLSQAVYNFLYHDITLKKLFKHILPLRWRLTVKAKVGTQVMKKVEMPADVREFLTKTYRGSIQSLRDLLPDPVQKTVIEKWLM